MNQGYDFLLKNHSLYDQFDIIVLKIPLKQVSIVSTQLLNGFLKPLILLDSLSSEAVVKSLSNSSQDVSNVSTFISQISTQVEVPQKTKKTEEIVKNFIIEAKFKFFIDPSIFLRLQTEFKPVLNVEYLFSKDKTIENSKELKKSSKTIENHLIFNKTPESSSAELFNRLFSQHEKNKSIQRLSVTFYNRRESADEHLPEVRVKGARPDSSQISKKKFEVFQLGSLKGQKKISKPSKKIKNDEFRILPHLNSGKLSKTTTLPFISNNKKHLEIGNFDISASETSKIVKNFKKSPEISKNLSKNPLKSCLEPRNIKKNDEKKTVIGFQLEEEPQVAEHLQIQSFTKKIEENEKFEEKYKKVENFQELPNETNLGKRLIQNFFNSSFVRRSDKSIKKVNRSRVKSLLKLKTLKL